MAHERPITYIYRYPEERPGRFFFMVPLRELTTMRAKIFGGLVCLIAVALIGLPAIAADDDGDKPKFKTKQVMKEAFKGPLLKKVAGGDGSAEDAKKLHAMLVALSKNEPPRGEEESWKELTGALVKAGKAAVEGDADAGAMLKKSANCKACHSKHKPS